MAMSLSCIHVAFGKSIVLTTAASMFTLEGEWPCQPRWTPKMIDALICQRDENYNNVDPKIWAK